MRRFAIRRLGVLGATTVLLASIAGASLTQAGTAAAPTGKIVATLSIPHTNFNADVTDPGDTLSYHWEASIGCGSWQPGTPTTFNSTASTASWYHGAGAGSLEHSSGVECSHDGGTNPTTHPGKFYVTVTDTEGNSVTCEKEGPGSGDGPACGTTSYDLAVTMEGPPAVDVGLRSTFNMTVTNKGPHPATPEVQLTGIEPVSGQAASHTISGGLLPGESATRTVNFIFGRPGSIQVSAVTDTDLPNGPPNVTTDNTDTLTVAVNKAKCTQKVKAPIRAPGDDDGANVKTKAGRQVVCTKGGDDKITVGDQDVVYSKGGDDKVTCKEAFCVLELGGGNDVAKCAGACYVNGGPGKDNCPEGDLVIKEGCEK